MKSINFLSRRSLNFQSSSRFYTTTSHSNKNKSILLSWGCNKDGKLGNDNELIDCESFPFKIEKFKNKNNEIVNDIGKIKDISCGQYHTMIINENNNLYTCGWTTFVGSNKAGGNQMKKNYIPTLLETKHNTSGSGIENNVKSVSSNGRRHILILTNDLKVYSYGVGSEYQLGHGNTENQMIEPIEIKSLSNLNVIKVVSGWGHSIALTENGDLYSWGWSNDSQTGHGVLIDNPIKIPTKIKCDFKFKNIYSGCDFVIAITDNGKLISFGCNEFGQLGIGNNSPMISSSTDNTLNQIDVFDENGKKIENFKIKNFNEKRIACGFSHALVLNDDGELFSMGWNGNGQLGIGIENKNLKYQSILKKLVNNENNKLFNGEKIEMVSAGRNHSVALTQSGRLYLWGNGNHGKLGNGTTSGNQYEPTELFDFLEDKPQSYPLEFQKVLNISCGFDHTIIELLEN